MYGILSDTLPVQGYHRTPYILAAALSGCVSWFGLGVIVTGSVAVVAIFLLIANYSIASPDVIIDASVAERCRDRPEFASDLQTLCWGALFTHSLTHSLTHPLLTHSLTHSPIHPLTHPKDRLDWVKSSQAPQLV